MAMKDAGSLAQKYATRAKNAAGDYRDGVTGAGAAWESGAAAAKDSYSQGVQAAISRDAFSKGIRASGGAHYAARASKLGADRYAGGVDAGKDRWAQNTQPYLQAVQGIQYPPRGPRRSPANQQRSQIVATTLGALKESRA